VSGVQGGARRMQVLYERGSISYPRADSDALSDETVECLAHVAARHRVAFDAGLLPRFVPSAATPHEGIHPLREALDRVDLTIPNAMLGPDDRFLQNLTRHWLRQGAPIEVEVADTAQLPLWAQSLTWTRPASATPDLLLFETERRPRLYARLFPAEEIALRALVDHGLGRPSSLVSHAIHAVASEVVDRNGLTTIGRSILSSTPEAIRQPETSRRIEALLNETAVGTPIASDAPLLTADQRTRDALMTIIDAVLPDLKPVLWRALKETTDTDESSALLPTAEPSTDVASAVRRKRAHRRLAEWMDSALESDQEGDQESDAVPLDGMPHSPTAVAEVMDIRAVTPSVGATDAHPSPLRDGDEGKATQSPLRGPMRNEVLHATASAF